MLKQTLSEMSYARIANAGQSARKMSSRSMSAAAAIGLPPEQTAAASHASSALGSRC